MKAVLVLFGGVLCMSTWQAYAADTSGNSSAAAQDAVVNSEGPEIPVASMSGAPSSSAGLTRAQVYQDLVKSQNDGEAARIRDFYKGQ